MIKKICIIVAALFMGACASQPKNFASLPDGTDYNVQIAHLSTDLQDAKSQGVHLLAPEYYENAVEELEDAKQARASSEDEREILDDISRSRAYLELAREKTDIGMKFYRDTLKARNAAIDSQAEFYFPERFEDVDDDFVSLTRRFKDQSNEESLRSSEILRDQYKSLEVSSIKEAHLAKAREFISLAKSEEASQYAKASLNKAEAEFSIANRLIEQNPYETKAISSASHQAENSAELAVKITRISKQISPEGNETAAIKLYEQQKDIARLETDKLNAEMKATEAEIELVDKDAELMNKDKEINQLSKLNEYDQNIQEIRTLFSDDEANIYTKDSQVIIQLYGLAFPTGKATLDQNDFKLLAKLRQVLAKMEVVKISVIGHTDSNGSVAVNQRLSKLRAETVKRYLISSGIVPEDMMTTEGSAYYQPVAVNKNPALRSKNRRVDIVLFTQKPDTIQKLSSIR